MLPDPYLDYCAGALSSVMQPLYDDVIKWKHFPRYWPFMQGIHRSPVNPPQGQWRGTLMFSLICAWINGWVNNREAGDLRRHRAHYDVIVISLPTTLVPYHVIGCDLELSWIMTFIIKVKFVLVVTDYVYIYIISNDQNKFNNKMFHNVGIVMPPWWPSIVMCCYLSKWAIHTIICTFDVIWTFELTHGSACIIGW